MGWGAWHYLLSLRRKVDFGLQYVGCDVIGSYVSIARQVFGAQPDAAFSWGASTSSPFVTVPLTSSCAATCCTCSPSIRRAVQELVRVARWFVLIGILVGERSSRIQQVWRDAWEPGCGISAEDEFDDEENPKGYNLMTIYSNRYLNSVIRGAGRQRVLDCTIAPGTNLDLGRSGRPKNDLLKDATRMMDGYQVSGYLIQPWAYAGVIL